MRFKRTKIAGAWEVDPDPHVDDRGRFFRAWCAREFSENGIDFIPVQANMGFSLHMGTVRGMHFQREPAPEAKLVRCTRGSVYDVVIDIRRESPSFGQWHGIELSATNSRMLFVPKHCAHGYETLEDNTEILYMTSGYYTSNAVRGVRFDDPAFGIRWPHVPTVVSEQDRNWPLFKG
jgi:dTDP-4-dehydrorhamnose 3,5-epimerase